MPAGQHGQLQPRHQIHREHCQVSPRLIRGKRPIRQLAQPRVLQCLDPVLAPAPRPVPGIEERHVEPRAVGQERGDPVAVRIEQGRFRPGMQRLSPQIDPCPRRVVLQLQHLARVDHPRIITLLPVNIQGWFPVLLLIDPPNEPLLEHRQRI